MKIRSKYKLIGGLPLLIGLNLLLFNLTYMVVSIFIKKAVADVPMEPIGYGFILFFVGLQSLLLIMLMKDCRYIVIYNDYMVFINPIFPFIRKRIYWHDIDQMKLVKEYSRTGMYDAMWLIKNEKLKYRISSFYYSNFGEMKAAMKFERGGRLRLNPIQQLLCLFGKKI